MSSCIPISLLPNCFCLVIYSWSIVRQFTRPKTSDERNERWKLNDGSTSYCFSVIWDWEALFCCVEKDDLSRLHGYFFTSLIKSMQCKLLACHKRKPGVKSYGDHRSCEIVERDTKESNVQWTKLHSPFIVIRQLLPKWVITRTPNHNPNLNSNPNYISSKWSCMHFNITYFVYDCPAKIFRASKPLKLILFVADRESW